MIYIASATEKSSQPNITRINRLWGTGYYSIILFHTNVIIETADGLICTDKPSIIIFDKFSKQHYYSEDNILIHDSIHFEPDFKSEKNILKNLIFNKPFPIENLEAVNMLMCLIISEHHSISKNKNTNIAELFKILVNKIAEEFKLYESKVNFRKCPEILCIRSKIMQNPGYNWTIKELAEKCKMSESFFQIKYKQLYSSTCIADVIQARLEMAKNLLKSSGYTIKEISMHCGYRRAEHFSRQFKEAYGVSPVEYRKLCANRDNSNA